MDTLKKETDYEYLIFAFANKNKKIFKKYTEFWDEIKNQIERNGGKLYIRKIL